MRAYVFDAYGTLFDVHSAVRKHAHQIGEMADDLSNLWRTKQLEYTWIRTLTDVYQDFESITADALDFAYAKYRLSNMDLRSQLLFAYDQIEPYEDVAVTLQALKAKGAKLAILSNGTQRMLSAALEHSQLVGLFDAVYSVDRLRCYKTDSKAYTMVTEGLGLKASDVSFQSSNRWDIAGATHFGFRTIWINRTNQPDEYLDLPPYSVLPDLRRLIVT